MSETALVTLEETMNLGNVLVKSGYFKDARDASQAVVKVLAGREMGFGPIASMQGIHIIQGKPSVGANLLGASIKRSGRYNFRVVQLTEDIAELAFFENGEEVGRSAFSMDDAKAAGLNGKDTWKKYPRNMLLSRAISNGARWYCPDVFSGVTPYTMEELGAKVDGETGDIIDVTPTPVKDHGPTWPAAEPSPAPQGSDNGDKAESDGNGDIPTSPKDLLVAINNETSGYYNAVPHMLHAIQKTTGDDKWSWPQGGDVGGYEVAYTLLVEYAEANEAAAK